MRCLKVLLLGLALFATGFIGYAVIISSTIATTYSNGSLYYRDILRVFGVTHIAYGFLALGVVGFIITAIGIFQKK